MATSTSRFAAPVRVDVDWHHTVRGAEMRFKTDVRFADERPSRAGEQDAVNDLYLKYGAGVALRACRMLATRDHRQYPQYRQYWLDESWQLAVCTTKLAGKGGTQALAGDLVIAQRPTTTGWSSDHGTFYSVRLGWNCGIAGGITWLP